MKSNLLMLLLLFCFNSISAQDVRDFNTNNTLSIGFGISAGNIKDTRLSNKFITAVNPKYSISYRQANDKRISQVKLDFVHYKDKRNSLANFNAIKSNVYYSYEQKIGDGFYFGGFFDHSTLLNFPSDEKKFFVNNSISYTLLQSLGPKISYVNTFDRFVFTSSAQTALLSYTVQPIYGHPYPEQFLDERVFNPTLEGLARPLVRSGKLLTWNKFRSMRIDLGFSYFITPALAVGLDYSADLFYANANGKSVFFNSQDLLFKASFIH